MAIKAVFYFDDKTVTVHSENTELVTTKFQSGYYLVEPTERSIRIECIEFNEVHDPFPNQRSSEVIDTVIKFMDSENKKVCREMGFLYKLNILMHGKQGVGKTALLNYIADSLIKTYGAIVFRVDSRSVLDVSWGLAEEIRKIQDNPIVFVMDEIDQYCGKNSEAHIKALLDGNRSIDNSLVLAATNYLDRIPDTLKERPSRFRIVSEIKPIEDKDVIEMLIREITSKAKSRVLFSDEDIAELVKVTDHITIDQVKNIIIDKIMDLTLDMPENTSVGFKTNDPTKGKPRTIAEFKEQLELFAKEELEKQRVDYHKLTLASEIPYPEGKEPNKYNHESKIKQAPRHYESYGEDEPMCEGGG